jgi:integrase
MARNIGKLTALVVVRLKEKGVYPDGGNLYLQVSVSGAKSWLFRYMRFGKAKAMGLGAMHAVSLAEARDKAAECRKLLASGIDPLGKRKNDKEAERLAASRGKTFKWCAEEYIKAHTDEWKNAKHIWQWENSLSRFVYPTIGNLLVQDIDMALVVKVLQPIWKNKTETATRVRGRIERILDWATVNEYRSGENPALWRGRLDKILARPSKIKQVQHHPALPYTDINEFIKALDQEIGIAAFALKLVILTATRTSEAIGAQWKEFDLKQRLWTIPAVRMKGGREHRVPLSDAALAILKKMEKVKTGSIVFPGGIKDKPLSNMALLVLLRRMERADITVHGFRSTFRDWAAEQTNYPREVSEAALAHILENKTEAAYRRSDLFDKRRQLMNEWARYCYQPKAKGKVLKIRG